MGNKLYLKFFAHDMTQSKNVIDLLESKQMFIRNDLLRKILLEKYITS